MESPLLSLLLDREVKWDQFQAWINAEQEREKEKEDTEGDNEGSPEADIWIPARISSKTSLSELSEWRPEVGLSVVNFVRRQIARILDESQQCYPTPGKKKPLAMGAPAAKYDYSSPVKSVSKKGVKEDKMNAVKRGPSGGKDKKRVQLFAGSKENKKQEGAFGEKVEDHTPRFEDAHKLSVLEERFNGPQSGNKLNSSGGGGQHPGAGRGGSGRRSLDSALASASSTWKGGSRAAKMPSSQQQLNLGDFLVPAKKQSKNKKKKGRASLESGMAGGVQQQNCIPGLSSPSPTMETPVPAEAKDCSVRRKTKSLSPSAMTPAKRVPLLQGENKIEEVSSPLAKVTDDYKAKFANANIWSQIVNTIEMKEDEKQPPPPLHAPAAGAHVVVLSSTPSKTFLSDSNLVAADPDLVTHREELDKLANLYSLCVDLNLVPNVLAELYFMTELLTVQELKTKPARLPTAKEAKYFDNVHNCVYFACRFLSLEAKLLENLDGVTLDLLAENSRVDLFSPELKEAISRSREARKKGVRSRRESSHNSTGLESVRFKTETDNNTNFHSDRAFQDFKKQRDLFYEVLRTWQQSQESEVTQKIAGHSFQDWFDDSVGRLVSMNANPVNLYHLARLVRDQMITTCLTEAFERSGEDVLQLERRVDPAKLRRLQSRFDPKAPAAGADDFAGPCPSPSFEGAQVFYRDLIQHCANYAFLTHLKNALVEAIVEKDAESFALEGIKKDSESQDPPASADSFATDVPGAICTLRILAKFLGFIESFPFSCQSDALPNTILDSQVKLREQIPPPLDFTSFLGESLRFKRLVLTLPWVVEYCSMLDKITLKSGYYQNLLATVVHVYKVVLPVRAPLYQMDPRNAFLLRLCSGWLFEKPFVPRELFFNDQARSRQFIQDLLKGDISKGAAGRSACLDESAVLSSGVLYACCPYLSELKRVLSQFKSGHKPEGGVVNSNQLRLQLQEQESRRGGRRKIELSSTVFEPTAGEMDGTDMNSLLEKQLFFNLPESAKRCVEFISSRYASSVIFIMENEVIKQEKEGMSIRIMNKVSTALALVGTNGNADKVLKEEAERIKTEIEMETVLMSRLSANSVRKAAKVKLEREFSEKYEGILVALLTSDLNKDVVRKLVKVAVAKASRKVNEWTNNNVTQEYFAKKYKKYVKDYWEQGKKGGMSKNLSKLHATRRLNSASEERIVLPQKTTAALLIEMKSLLCAIHDTRTYTMLPEAIFQMLKEVETCVRETPEEGVPDLAIRDLGSITVALALALLVQNPASMTADVQMHFMQLWKEVLPHPEELSAIISPMTLCVLNRSRHPKATWDKMESFLTRLLKHELLFPLPFEQQCVMLLRDEWDKNLVSRLASCLQGVVDSHKREGASGGEDGDFDVLMEWIVWYFQDVEEEFENNFPEL